MKKTNMLLVILSLLVCTLPFVYAVAVAPSPGVQYCDSFDGSSFENGMWSYGTQEPYFNGDNNGGLAIGNPGESISSISWFSFIQSGNPPFSPDTENVRTIAWRWNINTTQPPGNCGNTTADQSHHGILPFVFSKTEQTAWWNASDQLFVILDENYSMSASFSDNYDTKWSMLSSPVSAGWHTFVLKLGTGGAKLYIDGVLSGVASGSNTTAVPHDNNDVNEGYDQHGVGFLSDSAGAGGANNFPVRAGQNNACQYDQDNFVFDSEQWNAQRISEYTESNIASQGFTCTASANANETTAPVLTTANYSVYAGIHNFSFSVTDNTELLNASVICSEKTQTYTLSGVSNTLDTYFNSTINQTCVTLAYDSSLNFASKNFTITILVNDTTPPPVVVVQPTLTTEPVRFANLIMSFLVDVAIAFIVFLALVYPLWKLGKKK